MKWPKYVLMMRHDVSAYNVLKKQKMESPLYLKFVKSYEENYLSKETKELAQEVWDKFKLDTGDHDTLLIDPTSERAKVVGQNLRKEEIELPDIIFVSPFKRALLTFEGLKRGWPELAMVKMVEEERLREQGHGLALIYNDWRIFHVFHPKQKLLRDIEGPYWYQFPQGESVPDVRGRNRSWLITLTREFAGKKVLAISHHLNILATRANLERWSSADFIEVDEKEKPENCGVTLYKGISNEGSDGRFVLGYYNRSFF